MKSGECSWIPLPPACLIVTTLNVSMAHLSKLETDISILLVTKLQNLFKFHQFFHLCPLSVPGSRPGHHILFHYLWVSQSFSVNRRRKKHFLWPWQSWRVLARYPVGCPQIWDWGCRFLGRTHTSEMSFLSHHIREFVIPMWPLRWCEPGSPG